MRIFHRGGLALNSLRIAVAFAVLPALTQSQTAPLAPSQSAPLSFVAASIKPSGPKSVRDSSGGPGTSDPGRFHYHVATLHDLIIVAYQVQGFQLETKLPIDRQEFDLDAKVPEGATKEQFHGMLKNLLAERFHLKLHTVSKVFPAYALVVAKNGTKLKESTGKLEPPPKPELGVPREDGFPDLPPDRPGLSMNLAPHDGFETIHLIARQQPLSRLAMMLGSTADGRPVVDQTGLAGKYDFTLAYTREIPNAASGSHTEPYDLPDRFRALEQQLGLQLIERNLPFDVLVIVAADRMPTEN